MEIDEDGICVRKLKWNRKRLGLTSNEKVKRKAALMGVRQIIDDRKLALVKAGFNDLENDAELDALRARELALRRMCDDHLSRDKNQLLMPRKEIAVNWMNAGNHYLYA